MDRLKRLQAYNNSPSPILSLYIPTQENKNLLKSLKRILNSSLTSKDKLLLRKNITYISGFIRNYKTFENEKTLAIFSGGDSLFEVIHLQNKLASIAVVSHSPYLKPILQDSNKRFLIIFVDRKRALLFTMYNFILEEMHSLVDDSVPQNVKGASAEATHGLRDDKIQRHILDHLHRHFQKISSEIQKFYATKQISAVIIGGHKNEFSQFVKCLPKSLRDKVIGQFTSELNLNFNQLQLKAVEEIKKANANLINKNYSLQF